MMAKNIRIPCAGKMCFVLNFAFVYSSFQLSQGRFQMGQEKEIMYLNSRCAPSFL